MLLLLLLVKEEGEGEQEREQDGVYIAFFERSTMDDTADPAPSTARAA